MGSGNVDRERLAAHLRLMHRIRAFEREAIAAVTDKRVHGAIHPSIGQEGVAAGIVTNLRRDDRLLSTHRGHGHTLAKGADPRASPSSPAFPSPASPPPAPPSPTPPPWRRW